MINTEPTCGQAACHFVTLIFYILDQNESILVQNLTTLFLGPIHPLLKTTLTGLRRTYLRFLVFRPKLTKTKRFPPFLDHMNGKLFLGGSRFRSGKIGLKLAVIGIQPRNNGQKLYTKLIVLAQKQHF